jgi:ATP-dependent 26S proteasome regulatory subunit
MFLCNKFFKLIVFLFFVFNNNILSNYHKDELNTNYDTRQNDRVIDAVLLDQIMNDQIKKENDDKITKENNEITRRIDCYLDEQKTKFHNKIEIIKSSTEAEFVYEKDTYDLVDNLFPDLRNDALAEYCFGRSYTSGSQLNAYLTKNSKILDDKIKDFSKYIIDQLFMVDNAYKFKSIIVKTEPTIIEAAFNNKLRSERFYYYYALLTKEQKDIFYQRCEAGNFKYMLEVFKKKAIEISWLTAGIAAGYISLSFISNVVNTISNNLMTPFFNRWGKHKNFLAKLEFESIKNYNLENLAGYRYLKKSFLEISNELQEQKLKRTKIEGICLHGEPGNGKTQIIKALAGQAGVPLVIVNLNTLLNENGQIEENLNLLFEEARKQAPCIILLDEFDLIAGSRKLGKLSDGEKAILNEILQQLDGGKNPLEGVLVVANTNVISNIDFALQRPGRLGRVIEVAAPNEEDMREIMKLYLAEYEIKYDEEFISYFVAKLSSLPIINVAMIKNYIHKIQVFMKKNKQKKIGKNSFELISNEILA